MFLKLTLNKLTTTNAECIVNFIEKDYEGYITKEIKEVLSNNDSNNIIAREGLFDVENDQLPFKKLLNYQLISNLNYKNLKEEIKGLIELAIIKNIKSIAIPAINLPTLEYDYKTMYNCIKEVSSEYDNEDDKGIEITICDYIIHSIPPKVKKTTVDRKVINKEMLDISCEKCLKFVTTAAPSRSKAPAETTTSSITNHPLYKASKYMTINPDDFYKYKPVFTYVNSIDLAIEIADKKGIDLRKLVTKWATRSKSYNLWNKNQSFKKNTLFSIGFLADLNETEMIELLLCNGYSYNPYDPRDMYFHKYFSRKTKSMKFRDYQELRIDYMQTLDIQDPKDDLCI